MQPAIRGDRHKGSCLMSHHRGCCCPEDQPENCEVMWPPCANCSPIVILQISGLVIQRVQIPDCPVTEVNCNVSLDLFQPDPPGSPPSCQWVQAPQKISDCVLVPGAPENCLTNNPTVIVWCRDFPFPGTPFWIVGMGGFQGGSSIAWITSITSPEMCPTEGSYEFSHVFPDEKNIRVLDPGIVTVTPG